MLLFDVYSDFTKAKTVIEIMSQHFKVLGEYRNAKL